MDTRADLGVFSLFSFFFFFFSFHRRIAGKVSRFIYLKEDRVARGRIFIAAVFIKEKQYGWVI